MSIQGKSVKAHKKFKKFTKLWAVLYLIALACFETIILLTNFVPTKYMVGGAAMLGIISLMLFVLLYIHSVKSSVKVVAFILSFLLITAYIIGSAYAIKTDTFLDKVSKNKSKNATAVTTKPFNVYVSGMDTGGKISGKGRSDVNMIITVNPKTHKILMTSIPRDYQIKLKNKGGATDKLTHSGLYGIKTTISSVEELTGIKINYYIKVDYSTLYQLVESIGGIYVESDYEFRSYIGHYHFYSGKNHLNGHEALAFARERQAFKEGDVQRTKNQQKVLSAIINKLTSSTTLLTKYNKILNSIDDYIDMDFTPAEVKSLVKMQLDGKQKWTIEHNTITGFDSMQSTYSQGAQKLYVMSVDEESVKRAAEKIHNVMHPEDKKKGSKKNKEADDN